MGPSAGAAPDPQNLYLFQVVVFDVAGVPLQRTRGAAGRTAGSPEVPLPPIGEELEVVVILPDIDYDDCTGLGEGRRAWSANSLCPESLPLFPSVSFVG